MSYHMALSQETHAKSSIVDIESLQHYIEVAEASAQEEFGSRWLKELAYYIKHRCRTGIFGVIELPDYIAFTRQSFILHKKTDIE
jgi:hypothetical protein